MSFILALLQRSTTFSCPRTCRSTPNTRTLRVVAEPSACAVRTSCLSSCTVADSLIR